MTRDFQFSILETTIADVHAAMRSGHITCRELVQVYLDRIAAFDKAGPGINAVISLNEQALSDADLLDEAFRKVTQGQSDGSNSSGNFDPKPTSEPAKEESPNPIREQG